MLNVSQFNCKYCLKFSITCGRCLKGKCFNCYKFNKSKDILINFGDFFISNYVKKFLFDYFNVSDVTNYFLNMDVNELIKEKNILEIIQNTNKIMSNTKKEEKKMCYLKSKKFRHCKFI